MPRNKKQPKPEPAEPMDVEEEEEEMSSEDDDAQLLTDKVEEKLLSTLAKIRMKHPSIYATKEPLYQDQDFIDENNHKTKPKQTKYTYKDLVREPAQNDEQNLPPVLQERNAKEKFKQALNQNIEKIVQDQDDLFKIKPKISKQNAQNKEPTGDKFEDLTHNFDKQSKKILKKAWKDDTMDETDLFLKNYILDKKWLSSKMRAENNENQEKIDEQDEERSVQMDQYEQQYNFRFEEPGGTEIKQYPRDVKGALRQKTETRRQQRKKKEEKKKQEQQQMREEAEKRKSELRKQILDKLVPEEEEEEQHDWFFCDDCCKAFGEGEDMYECPECQDYMLCGDCNELIIHKHELTCGVVPEGFGAPKTGQNKVKQLEPCVTCRRRITPTQKRYQYTDRNYIVNSLCQLCYDQANLEIKKKYKLVESERPNYEEVLDQNPEKIKELTTSKQIQDLVDEYLKNDFEDVIAGGQKTKFRYIDVKPDSYGLSDEQILFGDDKQLNKYISIKKMAPYREGKLKLRNNVFNQKIKYIQKSVRANKNVLAKGEAKVARMRYLNKRRNRVQAVRKRMQKKVRLVNLSNKEAERNHFVPTSRLQSYGLAQEQPQA